MSSLQTALAVLEVDKAMQIWFPQEVPITERQPFNEGDLRDISNALRSTGRDSWSRIPRIYATLRSINQLPLIDVFLTQGLSDVWFPFSHKTLPESIKGQTARNDFIEAQRLVLTKSLDLEKEDGRHRHFLKPDDIPMVKLAELGRGGFGVVEKVISTISYKEYARKLIPRGPTFRKNKQVLREFEMELATLKKLSHLHIVELVGSYTDPRYVGILMSPVADFNLKDYLDRPLSEDMGSLLRTSFGCLVAAVNYLHQNRIRHKDIKPQNILIKDHQILVTDFGISRDWSDLEQSTTTGPTTKTPKYCSPEIAACLPRNSLSDIWSLGCVFLEMWTVLCGESVATLNAHLSTNGSLSTCYHSNTDSVWSWCEKLILVGQDSCLIRAKGWIETMMEIDQGKRCNAHSLLESIQESSLGPETRFSFIGLCCTEDQNSEESVLDSDYEPDVNAGVTETTTVSSATSHGTGKSKLSVEAQNLDTSVKTMPLRDYAPSTATPSAEIPALGRLSLQEDGEQNSTETFESIPRDHPQLNDRTIAPEISSMELNIGRSDASANQSSEQMSIHPSNILTHNTPSDYITSPHWEMSEDTRKVFDDLFAFSATPGSGVLAMDQCQKVFNQSRLDQHELEQIFSLVKPSNREFLNEDEFAVAMHLTYQRLHGWTIPTTLPEALQKVLEKQLQKSSTEPYSWLFSGSRAAQHHGSTNVEASSKYSSLELDPFDEPHSSQKPEVLQPIYAQDMAMPPTGLSTNDLVSDNLNSVSPSILHTARHETITPTPLENLSSTLKMETPILLELQFKNSSMASEVPYFILQPDFFFEAICDLLLLGHDETITVRRWSDRQSAWVIMEHHSQKTWKQMVRAAQAKRRLLLHVELESQEMLNRTVALPNPIGEADTETHEPSLIKVKLHFYGRTSIISVTQSSILHPSSLGAIVRSELLILPTCRIFIERYSATSQEFVLIKASPESLSYKRLLRATRSSSKLLLRVSTVEDTHLVPNSTHSVPNSIHLF